VARLAAGEIVSARQARPARLVAVDGVDGAALRRAAKTLAKARRLRRPGVSHWDASGIFGDLDALGAKADGPPSARTMLLLYAADLAFRLRWEIRPALAEGRLVIAAPYVDTAVAFGRAAGLDRKWLTGLFAFAPPPEERRSVNPRSAATVRSGFVEFAARRLLGVQGRSERRALIDRARTGLAGRRSPPD
jgi:hypothetical protein